MHLWTFRGLQTMMTDVSIILILTSLELLIPVIKKKIELKCIHINISIDPTKCIVLKYVDH